MKVFVFKKAIDELDTHLFPLILYRCIAGMKDKAKFK